MQDFQILPWFFRPAHLQVEVKLSGTKIIREGGPFARMALSFARRSAIRLVFFWLNVFFVSHDRHSMIVNVFTVRFLSWLR
jgi:hypothetical protein